MFAISVPRSPEESQRAPRIISRERAISPHFAVREVKVWPEGLPIIVPIAARAASKSVLAEPPMLGLNMFVLSQPITAR